MRFKRCLVIFFSVFCFLSVAAAQEMGEKIAFHFQITPKAGMHHQLETALKAHAQWRREQKDPWQWYVMQVVTGRDYGDYIVRSDEMDWAAMDAYEFREKGNTHFMTTVGPFMESLNSSITATNHAVSNWPEGTMPKIIMVEAFELKPGKAEQFWKAVAKAHKAFNGRMGAYDWATTMVGEGAGSHAYLVVPMQSWAEMKPRNMEMMGYLQEAYGQEGASQLMAHFQEAVSGSESLIVAFRPDLSIIQQ